MAWAFVQAKAGATTGALSNVTAQTFNSSTTTGNMGYAVVTSYGGTQNCTGLTDTYSNTWVEIDTVNRDPDTDTLQHFYCKNMTGGAAHIVTATMANTENIGLLIAEFSGLDTTAPLDVHNNSANGVSNSPLSNSVTTTVANELVITAFTDQILSATEPTYGAGYTKLEFAGNANNSVRVYAQYKNQVAAASVSGGVTTSGNNQDWAAAIASFKEAAGGGPTPPPFGTLMMMGCGR